MQKNTKIAFCDWDLGTKNVNFSSFHLHIWKKPDTNAINHLTNKRRLAWKTDISRTRRTWHLNYRPLPTFSFSILIHWFLIRIFSMMVADESSDVFFLVSVVAPLLFCCFAIFVCALNSIWKTRSKLEWVEILTFHPISYGLQSFDTSRETTGTDRVHRVHHWPHHQNGLVRWALFPANKLQRSEQD